jgi:hypothetical protein
VPEIKADLSGYNGLERVKRTENGENRAEKPENTRKTG